MVFQFETVYNQKAFTSMAMALRKTIRKKHSKKSHIFGWIVAVLGIILSFLGDGDVFVVTFKDIVTYLVVAVIILALVFEDKLNGYIAFKRNMKRLNKSVTVFNDDGYYSETELGNTQWKYENINMAVEADDYFVFIFDASHAQLYDKNSISGGSADEFRAFIEEKTGIKTERI